MHVGNDTTKNTGTATAQNIPSNKYSFSDKTDSESKNSTDSTKDSQNNQDGTGNNLHDSETVLSIPIIDCLKPAGKNATKFYKYEVKQHKKMVRILTVVAYVICVSMAAIVLSLYYMFLWDRPAVTNQDVRGKECDQLMVKLQTDTTLLTTTSKDIKSKTDKFKNDTDEWVQCILKNYNESRKSNESNYSGSNSSASDKQYIGRDHLGESSSNGTYLSQCMFTYD